MRNKIKDSWSKIKPSNATNERILSCVLRQAYNMPKERSNNMNSSMIWKICAPVAACLIVALIVVVPILIQSNNIATIQPPYNGEQDIYTEDEAYAPGITNQEEITMPTPAYPITPQAPTYELVINSETGRSSISPGRMPPGMSFVQFLPADKAEAVQPGLSSRFEMSASYMYDGEFIRIFAVEKYADIIVSGVYQPASIAISHSTGYPLDTAHDIEPDVSYVYGIPVIAGSFWLAHHYCDEGMQLYNFNAIFELGDYFYRIELLDGQEDDRGLHRLNEIVHMIIRSGPANLSNLPEPEIPALRHDILTQEEAFDDPNFGRFLPAYIPARLEFGDARRVLDQMNNMLNTNWQEIGYASIAWTIGTTHPIFYERIVSVNDREKFDVNLYTIPWMDSVPSDIIDYLSNPTFLAEEMSLDVVQARALYSGRRVSDLREPSMNFNIMLDDILIQIGSIGVSAEEVWAMIESILP